MIEIRDDEWDKGSEAKAKGNGPVSIYLDLDAFERMKTNFGGGTTRSKLIRGFVDNMGPRVSTEEAAYLSIQSQLAIIVPKNRAAEQLLAIGLQEEETLRARLEETRTVYMEKRMANRIGHLNKQLITVLKSCNFNVAQSWEASIDILIELRDKCGIDRIEGDASGMPSKKFIDIVRRMKEYYELEMWE